MKGRGCCGGSQGLVAISTEMLKRGAGASREGLVCKRGGGGVLTRRAATDDTPLREMGPELQGLLTSLGLCSEMLRDPTRTELLVE